MVQFVRTDGNAVDIYVEVTDHGGFREGSIYARDANSVFVYCHEGGDCDGVTIECPENNQNKHCKIYCDDDPDTDCHSMEVYTTNGYCNDVVLLCIGTDCAFGNGLVEGPKIYCGYDQDDNYCELYTNGSCIDFGTGSCNNGHTEESCHNHTSNTIIRASTTFDET